MDIDVYHGAQAHSILDAAARLRITVFRAWPYLYDGDLDYERAYLQRYLDAPHSIIALALSEGRPVGVTTGLPLRDAPAEMQAPLVASDLDPDTVFYCGESLVLPEARGLGLGHRFFDLREAHARTLGCGLSVFCAVDRPEDHPAKPPAARRNDAFWSGRGYRRRPEWQCRYLWKDVGEAAETEKTLTFWSRALDQGAEP